MDDIRNATLNPRTKKWIGFAIGAVAGTIFSLVTWGVDAVILASANGYLPWLQLAVGSVVMILFSAFCGFFSTLVNRIWFTFLTWFGWGAFSIYICSNLPFQYLQSLITSINPLLSGEISYAPLEHPEGRLFVAAIIGFVCCLFITLFFQNTLSQVWSGMYIGTSLFSLLVWLIFFIIFGVTLDDLYHGSSRNAIFVTNQTIQTAVDHPEYFSSPKLSAEKHVSGFIKQQTWLVRDRKIIVKSYDKLMETFEVLVDFDGYWVTCYEAYNSITICK